MNIAIATVYDGLNYGSFLQAYALKNFLEEHGHNVFFIQRVSEKENLQLFTTKRPESRCGLLRKMWRILKRMPSIARIMRQNDCFRKQFPYFQDAWKEFRLLKKNELDNIDCIICGSDEIWNLHNAYIDAEFFACADYGVNIRKLGIAVSAGNSTESEVVNNPIFVEAVNRFDNIVVRDLQTQMIVKKITGIIPKIVCDPTLLVEKNLFLKDKTPIIKEKYMLVYAYDLTKIQSRVIVDYAKKNGLKIISPCNYLRIADNVIYASPLDFANLMYNSECCFTTTFHGAIFSLLFAKRVCIYPKFPKVSDIANKLNASQHLWTEEDASFFEEIINRAVSHDTIDAAIQQLRNQSNKIILDTL